MVQAGSFRPQRKPSVVSVFIQPPDRSELPPIHSCLETHSVAHSAPLTPLCPPYYQTQTQLRSSRAFRDQSVSVCVISSQQQLQHVDSVIVHIHIQRISTSTRILQLAHRFIKEDKPKTHIHSPKINAIKLSFCNVVVIIIVVYSQVSQQPSSIQVCVCV